MGRTEGSLSSGLWHRTLTPRVVRVRKSAHCNTKLYPIGAGFSASALSPCPRPCPQYLTPVAVPLMRQFVSVPTGQSPCSRH